MITNFTDDIRKLQRELRSQSCELREPFIKLDKDGGAPILNYNLPQSAGFTMYGHQFVKGIHRLAFKSNASAIPENNFFKLGVAGMTEEELHQLITQTVITDRNIEQLAHTGISIGERNALQMFSAGTNNSQETHQHPDTLPPSGTPVRPTPLDNLVNSATAIVLNGGQPLFIRSFGDFGVNVTSLLNPNPNESTPASRAQPYFMILEEYTTKSYLGDYGAGRTIKTFSLLPGEKTTISVRTYKESNSQKSRSENILDSFSESSAREMERMIEEESGTSSSSTIGSTGTTESSRSSNVSANIGGALSRAIGFGASAGHERNSAQSETNTSSATRSSNARSLNKALDRHVAQSNSSRSIDVNTSSEKSLKEGEETSIVRELENINKSRVLNFVFRQLLQQYVSITYLSNIKIVFCNGYKESLRVVDVEELDILLEDLIVQSRRNDVRRAILRNYLTIRNYKGESKEFVELVRNTTEACDELGIDKDETERFWSVKRDITDTWRADENSELEITVPGPILNVATHTLRTSSVVVDAMLGQGEALDSFGLRIQDAAATNRQLENVEALQQVGIIQGIEDPIQRAEMYRKVFGSDCFCDNQNT